MKVAESTKKNEIIRHESPLISNLRPLFIRRRASNAADRILCLAFDICREDSPRSTLIPTKNSSGTSANLEECSSAYDSAIKAALDAHAEEQPSSDAMVSHSGGPCKAGYKDLSSAVTDGKKPNNSSPTVKFAQAAAEKLERVEKEGFRAWGEAYKRGD